MKAFTFAVRSMWCLLNLSYDKSSGSQKVINFGFLVFLEQELSLSGSSWTARSCRAEKPNQLPLITLHCKPGVSMDLKVYVWVKRLICSWSNEWIVKTWPLSATITINKYHWNYLAKIITHYYLSDITHFNSCKVKMWNIYLKYFLKKFKRTSQTVQLKAGRSGSFTWE